MKAKRRRLLQTRRRTAHVLAQRAHAKLRAKQRLGLELNRKDYQALVRIIRSGRASHWKRVPLNRSYFKMKIKGKPCLVLYDRTLHNVVTIIAQGPLFDEAYAEKPKKEE